MRSTIIILSILGLSGCAFKEEAPKSVEETTPNVSPVKEGLEFYADWSPGKSRGEIPDLKIKKPSKFNETDKTLTVSEPLTIPRDLQNDLWIRAEIPVALATDTGGKLIKVTLRTEESLYELKGEFFGAKAIDSKVGVVFLRIIGLDTVFNGHKGNQMNDLKIQIFGPSELIYSVQITLRHPPEEIEREIVLSGQNSQLNILFEQFKSLRFQGYKLGLVAILRLKNNEPDRIMIDLPRAPRGRLQQRYVRYSYQDAGCTDPGYRINENQETSLLSDHVIFVPLSRDFHTELENGFDPVVSKTDLTVAFDSEEERLIGIFVAGENADDYLLNGSQQRQTRSIEVDSTCYEVCVKKQRIPTRDPREPRPPRGSIRPHEEICLEYGTRRNRSQISVGESNRGVELLLEVSPEQSRYRYIDEPLIYPEQTSILSVPTRIDLGE